MSRASIRTAAQLYLTRGITSASTPISSLSTVYAQPPKLANEQDFYSAQPPGAGSGAVIYFYIGPTSRKRIAVGGPTDGQKIVTYAVTLMCYLRSTFDDAQSAGAANDAFLDSLVDWIEADRNWGTTENTPGAIFQAGEGDAFGAPDIAVHSLLPDVDDGGTMTFFTGVDVTLCEVVNT